LRDDIARALDNDDIAFAHVFAFDFVFVVQRGAADHHAADIHGFKFRHRR
jgi:hypothetical protein